MALAPILSLTDRAAERIQEIIANSDKPLAGLKVGLKKGGCAGVEYSMDMIAQDDENAVHNYDVVESKGVKLFIEKSAMLYLLGTEMDFETSELSSGFKFKNPNEISACGCGISVEITPATPERLAAYGR